MIAFNTLGRLYNLAYSEMQASSSTRNGAILTALSTISESRDEHAIEHYSWIPGVFLNAFTASPYFCVSCIA